MHSDFKDPIIQLSSEVENLTVCQRKAGIALLDVSGHRVTDAFLAAAAQPPPLVFSRERDRFMDVGQDHCVSAPPLGMVPSFHVTDRKRTTSVLGFKDYDKMNQWVLMGKGDILLLRTDGLAEHRRAGDAYCPSHLERKLREIKDRTAAEIFEAVTADLRDFCEPADDISLVVIKRAGCGGRRGEVDRQSEARDGVHRRYRHPPGAGVHPGAP
jgi:stage II sporulation SpoE-like protein